MTPPSGTGVPDLRRLPRISAKTWQEYEAGIRKLHGEASFSTRHYTAIIDGRRVSGVADNVIEIAGRRVAVEAKFVNRGDWANSIRNPLSPIGNRPFAVSAQAEVLTQAKKYSAAFDEIIYYSNSQGFIDHYTQAFRNNGIYNFRFILTN